MISDDPKVRPNIMEVKQFLTLHQGIIVNEGKIMAKDLGINDDLEMIERSISNDLKRRADVFEQCPFSAVNIVDSLKHLNSFEELSKAG